MPITIWLYLIDYDSSLILWSRAEKASPHHKKQWYGGPPFCDASPGRVNVSWCTESYMRQIIGHHLISLLACPVIGVKPLSISVIASQREHTKLYSEQDLVTEELTAGVYDYDTKLWYSTRIAYRLLPYPGYWGQCWPFPSWWCSYFSSNAWWDLEYVPIYRQRYVWCLSHRLNPTYC